MLSAIKKIPYDNCLIESPSGTPLAFCEQKRADLIQKKPFTIRLRFKPKIRNKIIDLDTIPKENSCLFCSTEKDLTRHHIVPQEVRKHLPEKYKSHNCHDLVLLCGSCHERLEKKMKRYREIMAEKYGVHYQCCTVMSAAKVRAIKAARALKENGNKIPIARRVVLRSWIHQFLDKKPNRKDIDRLSSLRAVRYKLVSNWDEAIQKLSRKQLEKFLSKWRECFVRFKLNHGEVNRQD